MTDRMRSPFGAILREERRAQGISQAELARRVAERFSTDPSVAELGVVSDRAIANIESPKDSAEEFVRPRSETVQVLMLGLGIDPQSERGQAMLRAANATQRREKPTTVHADPRFSTPFVGKGREDQWSALQNAWDVAQSGQPQIRLIEGTPGLGKSRLVDEFLRQEYEKNPLIIVAFGECSSGTANSDPYLPWRRAISFSLRAGMHSAPITQRDDALASALLSSVSKLGEVLIDLQDLHDWLILRAPDRLVELRRIRESLSPTNTTGRYDEFSQFVSLITHEAPTLVVLEDLHWADESSCSLLLHLQRQMRLQTDMPLLVIGTYRSSDLVLPEVRHPLHQVVNEIQRQVESVVISLESTMTPQSGLAFVAGLVDKFDMATDERNMLIQVLHHRTQGHPLFTTELIQRLEESNAMYQDATGTWTLDRSKIETSLPDRMRAIIDERVQRLPDTARTILEAASVQGSPFSVDLLPAITGLPESDVDLLVDRELMEKHRLIRVGKDASGSLFEFDHEFIAETVYESLTPRRRRALHRRTAEAIIAANTKHPMMAAAGAAHHYEQANMPAEAAEQALLSSFAAMAKLDHDLTLIWVDRSEALARAANDDILLWSSRVRRAHVLRSIGSLHQAHQIGEEGIENARRLGQISLEADAQEVVALVAYDRGQLDQATEAWLQSIDLYEQISRKDRVSANQSMLSHVACRSGRLDAAIRHAQAAWAAAPDATRDGLGAEALLAEGNALLELGRFQDAINTYQRSLETYRYTGEERGILLCRMNIALSMVYLGKVNEALLNFEQLQRELSRLQTPRLHAFVWLYQGKAHEADGNYRDAMYSYQQALITRRQSGLDAMAGDDLAGILRCAVALDEEIEDHLENLQYWWRTNDPRALEDPILAMLSLVSAYEKMGHTRLTTMTLNQGARMFLDRADEIQNPAIRDMYLKGNRSGKVLLQKAQEAGLVER